MRNQLQIALLACTLVSGPTCRAQSSPPLDARVIELTADKDSRFRLGGKISPVIEVRPGQALILRIVAVRAQTVARDGSVHGLALLDKNMDPVPGWRFFLHPGVQELAVAAPSEPGRYHAVCTIVCSDNHEGMGFTLWVTEPKESTKQ
ncbi:MAG: hypothetical protein JO356_06060 [Acidobacteria bacterium]|nr:hypothetical protein [Acidobacteriota bacterium]